MDTTSPCLYPASLVLLRICRQGRPLLAPSRIFTARVSTSPAQAPFHRFFTGEGACAGTSIQLSKNEVQAVYPWGLGWSRRARVKSRVTPSLIPESHRDGWESMSCCRIAVELLSLCCHFLLNGKQVEQLVISS